MSSDWNEIKRLASDFQKVQLTSTSQRLSERNCIEVVTLLIEKGLIDVIFTIDGKEYLTHSQLEREVSDELYVAGGRINLVELSKILNVDLQWITTAAEKVVEENPSTRLILGQLVNETYVQRIASEINEKLALSGELNVADLTVVYDLPSEFLLRDVLEKYLGVIVHGKQDTTNPRIFFTLSYVERCKAKIRGALAGITVPTNVSAILAQSGVKERIFFTLVKDVNVTGTLTSRSVDAQYIPHIHTKTQSEYVRSFFKQNGYLELASPSLEITDPKSFIQAQLSDQKYKTLSTCVVAQRIIDQVASSLEETIATNSYLDVSTLVPSAFDESDINEILQLILTPAIRRQILLLGSTVLTLKYLDELIKPCYEVVKQKAKEVVDTGKYQQYMIEKQLAGKGQDRDEPVETKSDKRDERRKKATGGSAGGGSQGRETKTKSVKKHNRSRRNDSESEDEEFVGKKKAKEVTLELINTNDIKKVIKKPLEEEGLEDLATEIASHYYPTLSQTALSLAHELYEATVANKNQTRRTTHTALQDKLNTLINDIRLYEKGLKLLPADQHPNLIKYLLKSFGIDICNEFAAYIATESNLAIGNGTLTPEQRTKIANECEKEYKPSLQALNKAVTGTSIDDFVTAAENSLQACSMVLKKVDKKKDRTLILCHKHQLLEQLANCTDPALVLHLAVLVVFTVATQNILHASGRHVSGVLTFLQPHMTDDQFNILRKYQDLVLMHLSGEQKEDQKSSQIDATVNFLQNEKQQGLRSDLEQLTPKVKEIAQTFKKSGSNVAE